MKTGGGFVLPTKPKPGLLNIDEVIKKTRPTTGREEVVAVEREREWMNEWINFILRG